MADDWVVTRLRGAVFQFDGQAWLPLAQGDVVSDDRPLQSKNGRATFQRDTETVDMGADSLIQIIDRPGKRYTTVVDHKGEVAIDAEHRNVQHFSVVTPYLAAVVKGTAFSVTTSDAGSHLAVTRGEVAMHDSVSGATIAVPAGFEVSSGDAAPTLEPIASALSPAQAGPTPVSLGSQSSDGGADSAGSKPTPSPSDATAPSSPPDDAGEPPKDGGGSGPVDDNDGDDSDDDGSNHSGHDHHGGGGHGHG